MKLLLAFLLTVACWGQITPGAGVGGGGTVGPGNANTYALFTGTGNTISTGNLAQDPATGIISSPLAIFFDSQSIAENSGSPVLDLSQANFFLLTMTQNDTMTLASTSAPISTQLSYFTLEVCDTAGGHTLVLPSGFSLAANPTRAVGECTTQSFWWTGTTAIPAGVAWTSIAPTVLNGPTRAAEATPASGNVNCWLDATDNTFECKDSTGTIKKLGSGSAGVTKLDYQSATGTLTGNSTDQTVFTTTVASIPAGGCVTVKFALTQTGTTSTSYKLFYGTFTTVLTSGTTAGIRSQEASICNNAGVTNAQQWDVQPGAANNGGSFVGLLPQVTTAGAIDSTTSQAVKLTFNVANTVTVVGNWWQVLETN